VEDLAHLGAQTFEVLLGKPEAVLADVSLDHHEPLGVELGGRRAPSVEHPRLGERDEPKPGVLGKQIAGQALADEAGKACEQAGGLDRGGDRGNLAADRRAGGRSCLHSFKGVGE